MPPLTGEDVKKHIDSDLKVKIIQFALYSADRPFLAGLSGFSVEAFYGSSQDIYEKFSKKEVETALAELSASGVLSAVAYGVYAVASHETLGALKQLVREPVKIETLLALGTLGGEIAYEPKIRPPSFLLILLPVLVLVLLWAFSSIYLCILRRHADNLIKAPVLFGVFSVTWFAFFAFGAAFLIRITMFLMHEVRNANTRNYTIGLFSKIAGSRNVSSKDLLDFVSIGINLPGDKDESKFVVNTALLKAIETMSESIKALKG